MVYISKGVVSKKSADDKVCAVRCGSEYKLSGEQARLWLAGRFRAVCVKHQPGLSEL